MVKLKYVFVDVKQKKKDFFGNMSDSINLSLGHFFLARTDVTYDVTYAVTYIQRFPIFLCHALS